jgi:hypothetical protein
VQRKKTKAKSVNSLLTGYSKNQARRIVESLPKLRDGITEAEIVERIGARADSAVLRAHGAWKGQLADDVLSLAGRKKRARLARALVVVEEFLERGGFENEEAPGFVLKALIQRRTTSHDVLSILRSWRNDLKRELQRPAKRGAPENKALRSFEEFLAWYFQDLSGQKPTMKTMGTIEARTTAAFLSMSRRRSVRPDCFPRVPQRRSLCGVLLGKRGAS